jgi:N6-adenosine-specific RNA methylase IME4
MLPDGPFDLILADPGWHFATRTPRERKKCSRYRTESVEQICGLGSEVGRVAARNSRLLLWVTNTHLHFGADVIRAWGFVPKSNWIWIKDGAPCMGWWMRGAHEILMIGARGRRVCPQNPKLRPLSWFSAPKPTPREHSRKPPELYDRIARGLARVQRTGESSSCTLARRTRRAGPSGAIRSTSSSPKLIHRSHSLTTGSSAG